MEVAMFDKKTMYAKDKAALVLLVLAGQDPEEAAANTATTLHKPDADVAVKDMKTGVGHYGEGNCDE
jgi:hypothetical protein